MSSAPPAARVASQTGSNSSPGSSMTGGGHRDAVERWRSRVHGLDCRRGDRCVGDGRVFVKVISERGVGAGGLGEENFVTVMTSTEGASSGAAAAVMGASDLAPIVSPSAVR